METIPSDQDGCVDPEALRAMLDERVRLIALTWLPANGGLINPAAAIGAVAREHGIAYFVDAAQAVGQLPIDVEQVGCDVLAGAGRALRGPRGTGLLYVRRDFLPRLTPAWVDTHSAPLGPDGTPMLRPDAARLESAEASLALRCGLANALREALDIGLDAIRARVDAIAQGLRAELATLPGVTVLDQGRERSGLVSFNVAGLDAPAVQRAGRAGRDHRQQRRELHAAGHDGARAGADRAGLGQLPDHAGRDRPPAGRAAPVAAPGLRRLRPPPGARKASTW